jgi:hypothetical protein
MLNDRVLDFLRAAIEASAELAAPRVEPVRLQVRTGSGLPAKPEMFQTGYFVLSWSYRVVDGERFHAFLKEWEPNFADFFKRQTLEKPQPSFGSTATQRAGYHGTFAVRGADGTPASRFKTLWGGNQEFIEIIEQCYLGRPDDTNPDLDEIRLATLMRQLLRLVVDEVHVEILDPTIGLDN